MVNGHGQWVTTDGGCDCPILLSPNPPFTDPHTTLQNCGANQCIYHIAISKYQPIVLQCQNSDQSDCNIKMPTNYSAMPP